MLIQFSKNEPQHKPMIFGWFLQKYTRLYGFGVLLYHLFQKKTKLSMKSVFLSKNIFRYYWGRPSTLSQEPFTG